MYIPTLSIGDVGIYVEGIGVEQFLKFRWLNSILKESYARGIQRYLTVKHYGTWDTTYTIGEYTGIFEDLEDANSTFAKVNKVEKPCDKVSGITVPMAEKIFFRSYSWDNFKDNLMEEYPNGYGGKVSYTTTDMNNLFKYWETEDTTSCPEPSSSSSMPSSSSVAPSSSSTMPSSSSVIESDGPGPDFKDTRDNYVYKTTKIGEQYWLAENLNYNAQGSRCYDDAPDNCKIYGKLYDWATAMALPDSCNTKSCTSQIKNLHKGICPIGWHLPTNVEWNKLILFIEGKDGPDANYNSSYSLSNRKLQSTSSLWSGYNGTDDFVFSTLPGGKFFSTPSNELDFYYSDIHQACWFWTATEGVIATGNNIDTTYYNSKYKPTHAVYKTNLTSYGGIYGNQKTDAYSIRCVKD